MKENNKNLDEVLENLNIKGKKIKLDDLLHASGIKDKKFVNEEIIYEDDEEIIYEDDEEIIYEDENIEWEDEDFDIIEKTNLPKIIIEELENIDSGYYTNDNEEITDLSYDTGWKECKNFSGINLGLIPHRLEADLDKLVVKASLRILDKFGGIIKEGVLLDQIYLKEEKQYGLAFLPVDQNYIKVLTAKDGVIFTSSENNELEYELIGDISDTNSKVEYKITINKIQSSELVKTGGMLYPGLAGAQGSQGPPGPQGATGPQGPPGVTELPVSNIIHVEKTGDDTDGTGSIVKPFLTIKRALEDVILPTTPNSYVIEVGIGTYIEDNSSVLIIPSNTIIKGQSSEITHISGTNTNKTIFSVSTHSGIYGITIYGITSASAIYVDIESDSILKDIIAQDCQTFMEVNHVLGIVDIYNLTCVGTFTNLIKVDAGNIKARNITLLDDATVETLIRSDGSNTEIHLWDLFSYSSNVTNGLWATGGSTIHGTNVEINSATNVLRASGIGTRIYGMGYYSHYGTTYDILQEDENAEFILIAGELSEEKMSVINWENINISFQNRFEEGKPSHIFKEEIHVGTPELGRSSSMGEGSSTFRGMIVYNYNGSTYTNVTSEMSSLSGSSITLGNTVDNAFYFSWNLKDNSGNYLKFFGLEAFVIIAPVLGSGNVIWEYWDGSAWTELKVMCINKEPPYFPNLPVFGDSSAIHDVRFNLYIADTGVWVANDPISSGIDRYWIRYRVSVEITSGVEIEYIRLHSNRSLISQDGWLQYFGSARPLNVLNWDLGLLSTTNTGDPPANQGIYLSDNLDVGRDQNQFRQNGLDRVGMVKRLPFDLDTSTPIKFQWSWFPEVSNNDIVWTIRWGYSSDGSMIYTGAGSAPDSASNEQTSILITPAGTAGVQQTSSVLIDVSNMLSRRISGTGDILWLTIERTGNDLADTNTGNAYLIELNPIYTKWCDGGHI